MSDVEPHRSRVPTPIRTHPALDAAARRDATPTATCSARPPASRSQPTASYTPPDSGIDDFERLQHRLGLSRAVFVQASCHGTDNAAMVDALERGKGRYAGVAMIDDSFTNQRHRTAARCRRPRDPLQLRAAPRRRTGTRRVLATRRAGPAVRLAHRAALRRQGPPGVRRPARPDAVPVRHRPHGSCPRRPTASSKHRSRRCSN